MTNKDGYITKTIGILAVCGLFRKPNSWGDAFTSFERSRMSVVCHITEGRIWH